MVKQIEIEVDTPRNECLGFRPLPGVTIRGRFDLARVPEPMARLNESRWPTVVPGQRLGIDAEGVGYISESLYDDEHVVIRERIEKAGMKIAPKVETYEGIDTAAWLHFMKLAVDSGIAKLTKGAFPDKMPANPRTNFILAEPKATDTATLTQAILEQNKLMAALLERMAK